MKGQERGRSAWKDKFGQNNGERRSQERLVLLLVHVACVLVVALVRTHTSRAEEGGGKITHGK